VQGAPVPPVTTSPIPAAGPAGGPVPGAPAPLPPQIAAAVDRVDPQGGMAQGGSQGQFTEAGISSMGAPGQGVSPEFARHIPGIFAGESGGDYDALFGFSNREGGPFGNVRLTDMTVNDAIAFSDPSGPYANWVKGQVGHVATPMGAYQVVGSTLRAAMRGMGLTGNERMTPELQDKIGEWIFENQGLGAWVGYRPGVTEMPTGGGGRYAGPTGGGMTETMSSMGTSGPSGGNMAIVMQLAELMGNPYLPEGQRMVAQMLIQQQMGTMFAQPMSQMDQIELERAQLELEQMRNPQPDTPDAPTSVREYQFYVDQELAAGREPMTFQDFTVLEAEAGNPALVQRQQDARDTSSDTIINAANRALEAARTRLLPSAFSGASAINPASPSAEVYRQVESLRSIAAVENINAMRQQSPTGAALGAASDRDIELLKDKSGALDPRSPNFERDLADYTRTLLQTIHGYEEGDRIFRENYAGNADTEDDDGENTVLRWNPATNSFDQVQQ
jgi:hypothetical protein